MKTLRHVRDLPFFLLLVLLFFSIVRSGIRIPGHGLDPSHQMVMSWAQTQGLAFGSDIIFTYGPYSALWNGVYTPDSAWLMLLGYTVIFLCFATLFFIIYTKGNKVYTLFALLVCCLFRNFSGDALYYSYIFLYTLSFIYITRFNRTILALCTSCLLTCGLGLIMLIKCGFIPTGFLLYFISAVYCFYKQKYKLVLCTSLTLLCSLSIFWMLAGQPLFGIIDWFCTLIPVTSGYAEAMARGGPQIDIVIYVIFLLFLSAVLLLSQMQKPDKVFLSCCFLLMSFMEFKSAFIRHHWDFGLIFLFFYIPLTGLALPKKQQILLCAGSLVYALTIYLAYPGLLGIRNFYHSIPSEIKGLGERFSGKAATKYASQMEWRKTTSNLPVLPGTSDIYNWDQVDLLVSGNTYNPRPIPQSYSAYTPELARLNAEHLIGKEDREGKQGAPDNIFFRVQAIDNRFPALADGLSWLNLLDRYHASRFSGQTLLLQRNASASPTGRLSLLLKKTLRFNETVALPGGPSPIFVKFAFKKGLFCKLHGILYKYPQLDISFRLSSGRKITKRIIAGMTVTGFFLSPYIETTKQFLFLATNNLEELKENQVTDFTISQHRTRLGLGHWDEEYEMELYKYESTAPQADPNKLPPITPSLHPATIKSVQCLGNLDTLTISGNHLTADGWLAMQAPLHPVEQIYLLGKTPKRTLLIPTTAQSRPDVARILGTPELLESGFSSSSEITTPVETYAVGYRIGDQVYQCSNLQKTPEPGLH